MEENQMLAAVVKTTKEDQRRLLRYYAKQPWNIRVEIMEFRRKIFHMLKGKFGNVGHAVLDDAALVLASKTTFVKEQKLKKLRFDEMSLEEIQDLSLISLKKFEESLPSSSPTKDRLIRFWAIVKLFYKEGKSVNKLRLYLLKEKKFEVSNTTILDTFRELEGHKWSEKSTNYE